MSVRTDKAQLIITIDVKESVEYQKSLKASKDGIDSLKKLEQGTDKYNDALAKVVQTSQSLAKVDYSKLSGQQLTDRKKQLEDLRKILPGVTFAEQGFEQELRQVNTALTETTARTRAVSTAMTESQTVVSRTEAFFAKLGPAIVAAFALERIIAFFSGIKDEAAKLDTITDKYQTVFGEASTLVDGFAENTAIKLGLSVNQFKEVTAATGDLLVPIGFAREQAALMSNDVVKLSASLALWEGGTRSTEEITKILNKALLGEREQLKELGVAISEDDVKQRLRAKGLDKATGEVLKQAKAIATLELITEGSQDAITQFNDKADSMGQVSARTTAKLRTMYDQFVELVKPAVRLGLVFTEKLATGAIGFISALATLPRFIKDNKIAIEGIILGFTIYNAQMILASANSLRLAAIERGRAIVTGIVTTAQTLLNAAMTANPIGLVIRAVGLLVAGFAILYTKSQTVRAGIAGISAVAQEVFTIVKEAFRAFGDGFSALKEGRVSDAFKSFSEGFTKANPIGIAFSQGKRLAGAFNKGFNDKIAEEKRQASIEVTVNKKTTSTTTTKKTTLEDLQDNSDTSREREKLRADAIKAIEEDGKRKLALLQKQNLSYLLSDKQYAQQKLQLLAQNLQAELDLLSSQGEQASEKYAEVEVKKLQAEKDLLQLRLDYIKEASDEEIKVLEEQYKLRDITESELVAASYASKVQAIDAQIKLLADAGAKETAQYKKLLEDRQKLELDIVQKTYAARLAKELELIDQQLQSRQISEAQYDEARLTAQKFYLQTELDALAKAGQAKGERAIQINKELLKIDQDLIDQRVSQIESGTDRELTELERKFIQKLVTEEEYNRQQLQLRIQALDDQLSLLDEYGLSETDAYNKVLQDKLLLQAKAQQQEVDNVKRTEEIKRALIQDGISTAQDVFKTAADLLSQDEAARKKHASAIKAFETANVLVSSYSEIADIFKSTAKWGPTGWILGTIRAALVVARAAGAISKINSQKFEKGDILDNPRFVTRTRLQDGGMFEGPSHSAGGVKFRVGEDIHEAEGGEAIINKRSTTIFRPILSAINSFNGYGKRFETGGVLTPVKAITRYISSKFALGDILPSTSPTALAGVSLSGGNSTVVNNNSTTTLDFTQLNGVLAAFTQVISTLPAALQNINATVSYSEIKKADTTVAEIQSLANY